SLLVTGTTCGSALGSGPRRPSVRVGCVFSPTGRLDTGGGCGTADDVATLEDGVCGAAGFAMDAAVRVRFHAIHAAALPMAIATTAMPAILRQWLASS